jgi:tRNA (adenine37-N6)-methyltransferase
MIEAAFTYRPDPVGPSVVKPVRREGNVPHPDNVDILGDTPILDTKPYSAQFDRIGFTRNGWQDERDEETARRRGRCRNTG